MKLREQLSCRSVHCVGHRSALGAHAREQLFADLPHSWLCSRNRRGCSCGCLAITIDENPIQIDVVVIA